MGFKQRLIERVKLLAGTASRKKVSLPGNLFDTAEVGEELEITGVGPCLGFLAYDPYQQRFYGAHFPGAEKRSLDRFFQQAVPGERIRYLKFLTFGYIPLPRVEWEVSFRSKEAATLDSYQDVYIEGKFNELARLIRYLQDKYKITPDKFIFRDSFHKPKFRNFDSMGILANPESGVVVMYGKRKKGNQYREIGKIDLSDKENNLSG